MWTREEGKASLPQPSPVEGEGAPLSMESKEKESPICNC